VTDRKKLTSLRKKIDKIDDEILNRLNERAKFVIEIGKLKQKSSRFFHALHREHEIFTRLSRANQGPFPNDALRSVFREIMSASLSLEQVLKVAYLGPAATFSHAAAIQQFGHSARFVETRSLAEIFEEVERGRADYGVVPIENTIEGVVNLTLDLFIDSDLKICGETLCEISHHLLSKTGTLRGIKRVYSHPQAIAQCNIWLSKHLPSVPVKEVFSTAKAAQLAARGENSAAIASEYAGKLYGLKTVRRRIEDYSQNFTRFWILGENPPGRTGHDKTSIMFSFTDRAGGLHMMLAPFAKRDINMTKIESRPFKSRPWEYIFFIDIEGYQTDPEVAEALREMEGESQYMKILGSYPKSTVSERDILGAGGERKTR
jgi:chorismate mutase/prephenate dehydratase